MASVDIGLVCDANALIDICIALHHQVEPAPNWWNLQGSSRGAVGAALSAGLCAPSSAIISVFLDAELEDLVLRKLTQPKSAQRPEDCGLGWPSSQAAAAYGSILKRLKEVDRVVWVDPPAAAEHLHGMDYEDSRIWGLFSSIRKEQPWCDPVLVTRDQKFAGAVMAEGRTSTGGQLWVASSPTQTVRLLATYRT